MIIRKVLREVAAKGIDKSSVSAPVEIQTVHAVATVTAEGKTHEWGLDVRCLLQKRESRSVTCAQYVERNQRPRTTCGGARRNSTQESEKSS